MDSIPKTDIVVVMGYCNAKAGTHSTDEVKGSYGPGETNERGWKLLEFCRENKLWISNTQFDHHPRCKYTWTSPDGLHRNQIDFFMIQQRWKSNITNCRAYPGADCDTDHNLVMATWRMKLKRLPKQSPPLRFDLETSETNMLLISATALMHF